MKTKSDIEREYNIEDWSKFFDSRLSLSKQALNKGYNYSTAFRHFSKSESFREWVKSFKPLSEADVKRFKDVINWCNEAGVTPNFSFNEWEGLVRFEDGHTLSNSYEVICPQCHQVFETTFRSSVPHMTQCPHCGYQGKGMSSYAKFSVKYRVLKELSSLNLSLISNFTSISDYHVVKCLKCGIEFSTTLSRNHINKCPYCSESHAPYNQNSKINKLCEQYGYKFLDVWRGKFNEDGSYIQYKVQCNRCDTIFTTFVNAHQLRLCPKCKQSDYRATRERKIDSLLTVLNIKHFNNYRFVHNGKQVELDIYCPDQKVAFEFNGYYWHNSGNYPHSKPKDYHKLKTDYALSMGINLYHIWESTSDELCQSIVLSKLGLSERVFARQLRLEIISNDVANEFLSQCHVDGYSRATINFALVDSKGIRCCLSLNTRRLQSNGSVQWEIARFASALNVNVVGGYSRCLKHALQFLKENGCNSLISYCNRDLSPDPNKTVYHKLGFQFLGDSGPIYKYWASCKLDYQNKTFNQGDLVGRQLCQKQKLLKWYNDNHIPVSNPTEFDLATGLGLMPCYNSGNFKYVLHF